MPNANPPPRTWCLRFKLNRTTILLHVDAQQPFASIRAELLSALRATNPSGVGGPAGLAAGSSAVGGNHGSGSARCAYAVAGRYG